MSFKNCKVIGENVTYADYHGQEAKRGEAGYSMSRSELVTFAECPARWIAGYGESGDDTASTKWGSMIDCLLTSPGEFDRLFAVAPETYPDGKTGEQKPFTLASKWCKEWKASQGEKTIIKAPEKQAADLAVKAIAENEIISSLFAASAKQVGVVGHWLDAATGISVPVRILIDLVPPASHSLFGKWLADFKTARNGNPANWARTVDDMSYDVQAALYLDLYVAATGEERIDFVHAVQENMFPFHVVSPPPALSSEFIEWGRAKYRRALSLYCQCLKTGIWPSYAQSGMPFGSTQIIGPDELFRYRKCAGMTEFKELPPEPETQTYGERTGDLIP